MPEWVKNKVTFKGNMEQIKPFLDRFKTTEYHVTRYLDFDKILPDSLDTDYRGSINCVRSTLNFTEDRAVVEFLSGWVVPMLVYDKLAEIIYKEKLDISIFAEFAPEDRLGNTGEVEYFFVEGKQVKRLIYDETEFSRNARYIDLWYGGDRSHTRFTTDKVGRIIYACDHYGNDCRNCPVYLKNQVDCGFDVLEGNKFKDEDFSDENTKFVGVQNFAEWIAKYRKCDDVLTEKELKLYLSDLAAHYESCGSTCFELRFSFSRTRRPELFNFEVAYTGFIINDDGTMRLAKDDEDADFYHYTYTLN